LQPQSEDIRSLVYVFVAFNHGRLTEIIQVYQKRKQATVYPRIAVAIVLPFYLLLIIVIFLLSAGITFSKLAFYTVILIVGYFSLKKLNSGAFLKLNIK